MSYFTKYVGNAFIKEATARAGVSLKEGAVRRGYGRTEEQELQGEAGIYLRAAIRVKEALESRSRQ